MHQFFRRKQSGFTLLETLVAGAIIILTVEASLGAGRIIQQDSTKSQETSRMSALASEGLDEAKAFRDAATPTFTWTSCIDYQATVTVTGSVASIVSSDGMQNCGAPQPWNVTSGTIASCQNVAFTGFTGRGAVTVDSLGSGTATLDVNDEAPSGSSLYSFTLGCLNPFDVLFNASATPTSGHFDTSTMPLSWATGIEHVNNLDGTGEDYTRLISVQNIGKVGAANGVYDGTYMVVSTVTSPSGATLTQRQLLTDWSSIKS